MNTAIHQAIKDKTPFTAVSFKSGQCQSWGVFNMVQDRKTGEYYNPQAKFDELMNKPDIMAMLNRLTIR